MHPRCSDCPLTNSILAAVVSLATEFKQTLILLSNCQLSPRPHPIPFQAHFRTMAAMANNCNWGTCIAPPTRRLRAHHRVNPCPGARRQNETKMFSDHDETSPSIAAVSAPSVVCSMLAVQQQKRLCRQFVDVSAARGGCHTMKHAV